MLELDDIFSATDLKHLSTHLHSENTDSLRHAAQIIDSKITQVQKDDPAKQVDPTMSLLVLVYSANIPYSRAECDEVIHVIKRFERPRAYAEKDEGIAIHLRNGRGFDLEATARKCFYMTTFTPERVMQREKRRGAPNISFYEGIGKGAYYNLGHRELPYHFKEWREHFASRKQGSNTSIDKEL